MTSPMQRTLAEIKKDGLKYWITEHWNPYKKVRQDMFNIIDLVVLDSGVVGVQVCGQDFSSHIKKLTEDEAENTRAWLESGSNTGVVRLELWGWRKLKKVRGGKAMVWKPRIADVLLIKNEIYVEERE